MDTLTTISEDIPRIVAGLVAFEKVWEAVCISFIRFIDFTDPQFKIGVDIFAIEVAMDRAGENTAHNQVHKCFVAPTRFPNTLIADSRDKS